jgi:response regulator RpfG family c-di-GMP phosphodiesterase
MRKTILVVEDDRSRRKVLVETLRGAGYDVIAGEDFQAALHMVGRLGVDVMISDLHLSVPAARNRSPGRRRRRPAAKQLFVSRVPLPGGPAAPHADDIVALPIDRTALLDKVRALIG